MPEKDKIFRLGKNRGGGKTNNSSQSKHFSQNPKNARKKSKNHKKPQNLAKKQKKIEVSPRLSEQYSSVVKEEEGWGA